VNTPSAIVLGGGRSTRYGRDKITAPWADSTLLQQVLAAIPPRRHEVLLVVREDQTDTFPGIDRVVRDDPAAPDGPLRGVVAGLRATTSAWNWVLGCDLPGLRPPMLELLMDHAHDDVDAVVFRHGGHPEPLVAAYARGCLDAFERALAAGEVAPRRALRQVRVHWIDEDVWRSVDPDGETFLNVNTPIDPRRASGTEDLR
jgi:molybdopterin-guanine dinucleotide biosynthesis protein A